MVLSTGQDHRKEFTFVCNVEKYQRNGTATSKKQAKQNAALQMIKLIEEKIEAKELVSEAIGLLDSSSTLTIEELPSIDEVLAEYRRIKNKSVVSQTMQGDLRSRNNFFLKISEDKRFEAEQVLMQTYSNIAQAQRIFCRAMKALDLKYEIKLIGKSQAIFTLIEQSYDCTITTKYDELFERIIDYLKNMLNMQQVSALTDLTNKNL